MSFLKKLFGHGKEKEPDGMSDHLVRLHVPLLGEMPVHDEFERYNALEDALGEVVERAGVGSLDGNEVGGDEYTICLYGPSGVQLSEVVKRALESQHLPPGCSLFVRHGGVNDAAAREEKIPLT